VAAAPGSGTPTGTVQLVDGDTLIDTEPVWDGVASFTTTTLAVGSHDLTAVYAGDANFAASTSDTLSQGIGRAGTTTTLTSDANASLPGQAVTLVVTVQ